MSAEQETCRSYVLAMLRELAILLLQNGEHRFAEKLMILVNESSEPSVAGAIEVGV